MKKKRIIEIREYSLCFIPVPIYLISTIDEKGILNIAPYGMIMPISYNPLIISVGSDKDRDTYRNILQNKEFVLNVPSIELLKQVNRTADPIPSDEDEFLHANLTPLKSEVVVPPRIEECKAHFECKTIWIKEASENCKNRVIITAEVVSLSLDEDIFMKDLCKQKGLMNPLYYEKHSYFALGGYVGSRRMR